MLQDFLSGQFFPLTVSLISFILLVLVALYIRSLNKRVVKLSEDPMDLANLKAREIIKHAQEQAISTLKKAQTDASTLLSQTATIKSQIDGESKIALEHATDRYMSLLEADATELSTSYKKIFTQAIEQYLKDAEKVLAEAKKTSQSYFKARMDEKL